MIKVLITGSKGFIGSNLKAALKNEKGIKVECFSREDGNITNENFQEGNYDHIVHLAGLTSVPESWKNPGAYYMTNVMGTQNVLNSLSNDKTHVTILTSYVYGIPGYLPIDEKHPLDALNPYGHSKLLVESLCDFYRKNISNKITVFRLFNLYGPNQAAHFLIPEILEKAFNKNKDKIIVNDLIPKRDYLYVDDFVNLLTINVFNPHSGVFNVGYGNSYSVEQIIKEVINVTGIQKEYSSKKEKRKNEVNNVVADITKVTNTFNWIPQVDLNKGIRKIINFENQ